MPRSIPTRWRDVNVRIFQDGVDQGTFHCTELSVKTELAIDSSVRQGSRTPDRDAEYMGGSGSMTVEEHSGLTDWDRIMDRHEEGFKEGRNIGKLELVVSHRRADPLLKAFRLENVIMMRDWSGGQRRRLGRTLSFEFDELRPVL
jgi:hypothetical protein